MTTTSIPTSEWRTTYEDGAPLGVVTDTVDDYATPALAVGDRGYLLMDYDTGRGTSGWWIQSMPGRTNLSHEPCAEGWLGSINNVSTTAHGYVEVVHVGPRVIRVRKVATVEHDGQQMSADERLVELATELRESRDAQQRATDALREAVREAHADGMSRYRIVQVTGLAPDTVKAWVA